MSCIHTLWWTNDVNMELDIFAVSLCNLFFMNLALTDLTAREFRSQGSIQLVKVANISPVTINQIITSTNKKKHIQTTVWAYCVVMFDVFSCIWVWVGCLLSSGYVWTELTECPQIGWQDDGYHHHGHVTLPGQPYHSNDRCPSWQLFRVELRTLHNSCRIKYRSTLDRWV